MEYIHIIIYLLYKWCESQGPGCLEPRRNEPDFSLYFFIMKESETQNLKFQFKALVEHL